MTIRQLYSVSVFFGFTSALAQVLLIRELLTVFRGSEFIIGVMFASWFLGISMGARYNTEGDTMTLQKRTVRALIVFTAVVPLLIYGVHCLPVFLPLVAGTFYSIGTELALCMIFTVPASFMVGYFFPPVVTLASRIKGSSQGGHIYMIEALGAFSGGALFSFVLVDLASPLALWSAFAAFAAVLLAWISGRRYWFIIMPVLAASAICAGPIESSFFGFLWSRSHTGTLVDYRRTHYSTVSIEYLSEQYNLYGDGIYYFSIPDHYESRPLFHLIRALGIPGGGNMLVTGGGNGSLPRNLSRSDIAELHYCEIDRQLTDMTVRLRNRTGTGKLFPKLRIVADDARQYLRHCNLQYDMVICLPPPPENAMLNRFYTAEFYKTVKSRLSDRGLFIARMPGFAAYMNDEHKRYLAACYRNFTLVFPEHLYAAGEGLLLIGAARPNLLPENPGEIIDRYAERATQDAQVCYDKEMMSNFNAAELGMMFEQSRMEYFKREIVPLAADTRINTDLMPRLYRQHLLHTAFEEGSRIYLFLKDPLLYFIPLLVLSYLLFRRTGKNLGRPLFRGSLYAAFTGFISIAVVIVLIQTYQAFYGIIYYRISLITAVFMLGLTAGAWLSGRSALRFRAGIVLVIIFCMGMALAFTCVRYEFLFWSSLFLFAASCGTMVPSLFLLLEDQRYHRTASVLDAAEHYGSIIGSLLVSMGLIPLAGIRGTLMILIAFSLLTAVYAFAHRRGEDGKGVPVF